MTLLHVTTDLVTERRGNPGNMGILLTVKYGTHYLVLYIIII